MAAQPLVDGRSAADLFDAYLHDALPNDYVAVYEPIVQGQKLDTIIVGPQGLFVLLGMDWQGEITPTPRGPWQARLISGEEVHHPNPAPAVRRATQALEAFLRDEFPDLHPSIHPLVVLLRPEARLSEQGSPAERGPQPPILPLETLSHAILDTPPADHPLSDPALRQALATALQERQLTRTQRAAQPFIFRSGGWLGRGKKAYTILQVIKHLDRHPEDGIHHLRNGSLARWFREQGALHLAALATEVEFRIHSDPRVPLERFMLGTGLVSRPRLVVKPSQLDMGYVVEGHQVSRSLRLRKGRGRGYLYGTLETSDPWITAEPSEFTGALDAFVTVDTSSLLITEQPTRGYLSIRSNATENPLKVPLLLHVMPLLSPLSRYLLYPLAVLLIAGGSGAALGWLLGAVALAAPPWLLHLVQPPLSSRVGWTALSGLFWAILGLVRGYAWPPAWPLHHGLCRWLTRIAAWGIVLASLTLALPLLLAEPFPALETELPSGLQATLLLFSTTIAALAGTWGDMLSSQPQNAATQAPLPSGLQELLRGLAGVIIVLFLLGSLRMAIPLWQLWEGEARVASVQDWIRTQWTHLELGVDEIWDRYYLWHYDRRVPIRRQPTLRPPTTPPPHQDRTP